ncbi:MAG TPA: hypothetical protein VFV11_05695 [Solimonas sp.]|nr:hypothetical protein [Solimonas sp.]
MAKLPLLLLCLCLPLNAAAGGSRSYTELFYSEDNEDLSQRSWLLGHEFRPDGPEGPRASLAAGQRRYADATRDRDFDTVRAQLDLQPAAGTELRTRLQPLWGWDWSPVLGSVSLAQTLGRPWRLELSAERELVDSLDGLDAHLAADTYALAVDRRLGEDWTLVAGGSYQDVDDGNQRQGRLLRLIWNPGQSAGSLQLRARRLDSEFRSSAYFSPRRLEEALLLGQWRQPLFGGKALLSLQAGGGQQWLEGGDGEALYQGELRLRGWLDDRWGLESRVSCSNTGGFGSDAAGSGYRYCEGLLSLLRAW